MRNLKRVQSLLQNNALAFSILLLTSVLRPEAMFPGIGLPVGPACLLSACFILILRIQKPLGWLSFYKFYQTEILILLLYQVLCLVSLFINIDRFASINEMLRWGGVFIVAQLLLPLCAFIFLIPNSDPEICRASRPTKLSASSLNTDFAVLFILTAVSLVTIIQVHASHVFNKIGFYFVAWDLVSLSRQQGISSPVSGVFATSTDLGAIMAAFVFLLVRMLYLDCAPTKPRTYILVMILLSTLVAGILSLSRNFFLFISVAVVVALCINLCRGERRVVGLIFCLSLVCTAALILLMPLDLANDIGRHLPFVRVFAHGGLPDIFDFAPRVGISSFGLRGEIWMSALQAIKEQPFIGISNGGFRLNYAPLPVHNTHNVFLQVLVDAGLLGGLLALALLTRITWYARRNIWLLCFLGATLSTLMVDDFLDHSYAWCVCIAFVAAALSDKNQRRY